MKYDYLVVGAGLFGAAFAQMAKEKGKRVLVIDKRSHIAGNIYTEDVGGIAVHRYGAHIFHTDDEEVWQYANRFATFNRFTNAPLAKYQDRLYHMPFNMNTFYAMWGVTKPNEAREIIERQRKEITGEPQNLEEQAISLVGRDIYEALVRGYSEKQWGRPAASCPPSSSAVCPCASPMTTTTSTTATRASRTRATRRWWRRCWMASKCV